MFIDGPVVPTAAARSTLRPLPLDAVALAADGHLGRWQQLNAAATLPHCIDNLESSGALGNLRHAADRSDEPFTGMWFADSDVYKTLEAACWELGSADDPALRQVVDETTTLLAAAQEPDGYLNSWFQVVRPRDKWADLRWGHELYCAGHLIQAGVAALRAGASPELVTVARAVADLIVARFGPDGGDGICGHPEVETALVELYRATGDRSYLDTAGKMINLRGRGLVAAASRPIGLGDARFGAQYLQDHAPVREATAATGHAVRQLYLEAGVVDVAAETGDAELLAASELLWDDLFGAKTYVTGAHGSRHRDEAIGDPYELPADRAYAETCAAIASFHWNWRLLLATGRHRYADEMERVLYNAVAASTARDGRHFFYSNPLQLRAGHDGSDEDAPSQRLSWYGCACCPPNLSRLMAPLHGYVATRDATGLQLHLFSSLRLTAAVPGGTATLRVATEYPWNGRITVRIEDCDSEEEWTLSLRVPGWCAQSAMQLDGTNLPAEPDDGYLRIRRVWSPGNQLSVELDLAPRFLLAHPEVDAVRGCVALARGPLVYCAEQADLPADTPLADVRLDTDTDPWEVPGPEGLDAPVVLACAGRVTRTDHAAPLYATVPFDAGPSSALEVRAVPYYLWANRRPGAMRVWIPTAGRSAAPLTDPR